MSTPTSGTPGTSSRSSSNRFADSAPEKDVTPVRLPTGRFKLLTSPSAIAGDGEDDRNRRGRSLGGMRGVHGGRHDHSDFQSDQIGSQDRQTIIVSICEEVFDSDIAAFGMANVTKTTAECNQRRGIVVRRAAAQIPNDRHGALLCSRRARPRRRAAESNDEFSSCKGGGHLPAPVLKPKAKDTMTGMVVSSGSHNSMHGRLKP